MNTQTNQAFHATQAMTGPCWRLVFLLMAICFLAHFNRNSMPVAADLQILPNYEKYEITPTQMGVVYSAFLATYTLFMIPGGWLIDRRGPKFALQLMCLGSAIFVILTGVVGIAAASTALILPSFMIVRSIMGLVSSPLHPAAANAVSLGIPPLRRSAANGMVTGAALLGVASSYLLFGGLIDWLGWPAAFVVAGTATIVVGILWMLLAPVTRAEPTPRSPTHTSEISLEAAVTTGFFRRNKNLLLVTASYAAVGYFQYLFFYWMHFYFKEELKLGDQDSRFYAAIPPLAMAFGMPLGGLLADRIQSLYGWRAARGGLAASAMVLSAILLLLGVQAKEPAWIVTWMSLALGVLGTLEGPFWVTAVEVGRRRGGFSAGVFNTGGNLGGIIAPVLTPWISEDLKLGWPIGLGVGSAVCVVGAVLWLWIDDPREESKSRATSSTLPNPAAALVGPATANNLLQQSQLVPNSA